MNKMKKFASIATAVLMTACMAAPMTMSLTSSATTTYTLAKDVTLTSAQQGVINSALKVESGDATPEATAQYIYEHWDTLKTDENFSTLSTKTKDQMVTATTTPDADTVVTDGVETAGKIKIYGAIGEGHTYKAYKIFSGDASGSNDSKTLANAKWGNTAIRDAVSASDALNITAADPDKGVTAAEAMTAINNYIGTNSSTKEANAKALGKLLGDKLTAAGITDANVVFEATNDGDITINGDGWYLIVDEASNSTPDTKAYSAYILGTVDKEKGAVIQAKSEAPTVMKKVQEGSLIGADTTEQAEFAGSTTYPVGDGYNDIADYNVGDTVPFRLYGTLPSNIGDYDAYKYVFHDTLSKKFAPVTTNANASIPDVTVKIKIDTTEYYIQAAIDATGYKLEADGDDADNHKFKVTFDDIKSIKLYTKESNNLVEADLDGNAANNEADGKQSTPTAEQLKTAVITVDYNAKLTSSAVVGLSGQDNAVTLEYSNNPKAEGSGTTSETPPDRSRVYTYGFEFDKTFAASGSDSGVTDEELAIWETNTNNDNKETSIKFKLKTNDSAASETNTVYVVPADETEKAAGWDYVVVDKADDTVTNEINEFGLFKKSYTEGSETKYKLNVKIKGLDKGTYYLDETRAPEGYNAVENVKVEITADEITTQTWNNSTDTLEEFSYTIDSGTPVVQGAKTFTASVGGSEVTYTDVKYNTDGTVKEFMNGTTKYTVDYTSGVKITEGETELSEGDKLTALTTAIAKLKITGIAEAEILNQKGDTLPNTGGIGTTLFYVGGGSMVAVAGIFLITKKRMGRKED